MKKFFISLVLGLLSPLLYLIGARFFQVDGSPSIKGIVVGCLAVVVYLAICQIWVLRRTLFAVVLGYLAPFVFTITARFLQVDGSPAIKGIAAGSLAVALFLAISQFCTARKGSRGLGVLTAMTVPLFVGLAVMGRSAFLVSGLPMLIAGLLGIFIGAVLAMRMKPEAAANTAQG
jgi:hypothetical protein